MRQLICLVFVVATLAPAIVMAGDAPASVFPPDQTNSFVAATAPKGYHNNLEIMAALGLKQIKAIKDDPELPVGVREFKNIDYGQGGGHALKLDLYLPPNTNTAVPALLFIHGGGWSGGDRSIYRYYTKSYAAKGYVAATASYRLSGEAPFPAAVQDIKCAVRFLRAHAKQYGINPDKIAALGGSAGGHLSMMAGYAPASAGLEGNGGWPEFRSQVQAVVNFYGPCDLTTPFAQTNGTVSKFLGRVTYGEQTRPIYEKSSPAHHLSRGAPPTLIFHGTIDDIVPVEQSDRLALRLQELGVPHVYHRLEGWPHTLDLALNVNDWCQQQLDAFLNCYLPLPGAR